MTARELIAYALIAAIAFGFVGWIAWARYNSRERKLRRQWDREDDRYRERRNRKGAASVSPQSESTAS